MKRVICIRVLELHFSSSLVSVGPGGVPSRDERRRFGVDRVRPRLPLGFHKQVQLVW